MTGLYAIPLMGSFLWRDIIQEVVYVEKPKLHKLMKLTKDGFDVSCGYIKLDKLIQQYGYMCVFVCLNDSKCFDVVNDFYGSVSTFYGKSTPSVDGYFATIQVPKMDVSVHYKITSSHTYADYIRLCVYV